MTASATKSSTKAQLQAMVADLQAVVALKDETIASLQVAATTAGQAESADERPIADHCMTGFLRAVVPAKNHKTGQVIEGLYRYSVEISASVNFGGSTRETWDYQSVNFKTSWFDADETLAAELRGLIESSKWVLIRNHFNFRSNAKNVVEAQQLDFKTKAPRFGSDGQPLMERKLRYAPDMRGAYVEVIKRGDAATPASDENQPF